MARVLKAVAVVCLMIIFSSSFMHLADDVVWSRRSLHERFEVIPAIVVDMEDAGYISVHREQINEHLDKERFFPFDGTKYVIDQIATPIVDKGDLLADNSVASARRNLFAVAIALLCVLLIPANSKSAKESSSSLAQSG